MAKKKKKRKVMWYRTRPDQEWEFWGFVDGKGEPGISEKIMRRSRWEFQTTEVLLPE